MNQAASLLKLDDGINSHRKDSLTIEGSDKENDNSNGVIGGLRRKLNEKHRRTSRSILPRSTEQIDDIYRSVSNVKLDNQDEKPKKKKVDEEGFNIGQDSPTVVSNPWSFFNRNGDPQEARYESEEEENRDRFEFERMNNENNRTPNQGINDNNATNEPNNSYFALKFPRNNSILKSQGINHFDGSKQQKFMRKLFGRRKTKDRLKKQSVGGKDLEEEEDDGDRLTGERARLLLATLFLGSPSINLLASCLLEDEFGISRAPLLLTLLGFKVSNITPNSTGRIKKFCIDLEYGVGPQRLKWSVERTPRDLLYLHSKFKFENWRNVRTKNQELPKLPIPSFKGGHGESAIGKLKGRANKKASNENNETDEAERPSFKLAASNQNDTHSLISTHSFRDRLQLIRSHLSHVSSLSSDKEYSSEAIKARMQKNQEYIQNVTNYLYDIIRLVALKPQSNRLFQFFEISPISSLLSYETGYAGKQGVVHIGGTAKTQGWRVGHFKANDLKGMIDRRSEKWLLVRHSYIIYVSSINSTVPLDVFLVDSKFKMSYKGEGHDFKDDDESDCEVNSFIEKNIATTQESISKSKNVFKQFKIVLENSERKLVLIPKSLNEQRLWIQSINEMKNLTVWAEPHRFDSFAPVREDCFAQWFVDGRDYFWALSSALEMAKDVIFIHDWWLSPELYLRRPANGNQQWRLDRLLQRKANQGVKIFVIVYRNVGTTVATDSLYTKHSILSLNDDNIHVIRSPNQLLQNTYFWAHHEKLCIIDQSVAFLGGIDLCYGRYDTPDHVITDDSKVNFESLDHNQRVSPEDYVKFQTFPGKDYSNPRVKDFFDLDKPYESMYDRDFVPRMPWHDIHMVTSGKIARDLARHFVQRWNYLLRQKRPSRFTPILTPPSDLSDEDAKDLGLDGTCEIQLLRSSGNWSLGLKEHEQSIQNAYLKLIETSEHFVYIENQFFVTSCVIDGTEIHNRIGDALVDRIIKAYNEGKNWKAIIVIPLMPGFESQVDEADGSSVRVIMQCQFMSISRGSTSIFAKLRKYGIDPDDYIQFFSLRKWGRIGPNRKLVTEQLYIHAKTMIVDDRAAIIGSANINERSMRGLRDSEVAAIVRDKEMVTTKMDGQTYLAGKFSHTLRMRLMREHLGVDVDILDIVERKFQRIDDFAKTPEGLQAATTDFKMKENLILSAKVELAAREILNQEQGTNKWLIYQKGKKSRQEEAKPTPFIDNEEEDKDVPTPLALPTSFNNRTGLHEANKGIRDKKKHSYDPRVQHNEIHKKDVYGEGLDQYRGVAAKRARLNSYKYLKVLAHKLMQERPSDSFLPDTIDVSEFLESNDKEIMDEYDDYENVISERNKERWKFLKKVAYLQRVASKENDQKEEEAQKRQSAGFRSSQENSIEATNISLNEEELNNRDPSRNADEMLNPNMEEPVGSPSPEKRIPQENSTELNSENIPIVTLNEEGVRNLIQGINSNRIYNFSKFVDPYVFEDPLDPEFYEDMWFEHARRNTEIFRIIFHTQPDDMVVNWKDYKSFSKLNSAFSLAQDKEAELRKQESPPRSRSSSEVYENIDKRGELRARHRRRSSQVTINVHNMDENVGLLGQVPPTLNDSNTPTPYRNSDIHGNKEGVIDEVDETSSVISLESKDQNSGSMPEQSNGNSTNLNNSFSFKVSKKKSGGRNKDEATPMNGSHENNLRNNLNVNTSSEVNGNNRDRHRRGNTFLLRRKIYVGERIFEGETAERILQEIQGHLVLFPADWLQRELDNGNWFYSADRIPPMEIYD